MPMGKGKNTLSPAAERVKAGDLSELVDPLDFHIIDTLPDFDTNLGGMYQLGETAAQVAKKINDKAGVTVLTSATAAIRLRLLVMGELARVVRMVGSRGSRGYQQTLAGKEVLKTWQAKQ